MSFVFYIIQFIMKLSQPALNLLFEQFQERFVNNTKKT
jgi:hypothetical protein